MGHARCYVTFDVVRRILGGDYLGYRVNYVMGIRDLWDPRVIRRARSRYLFNKFREDWGKNPSKFRSANIDQDCLYLRSVLDEAYELQCSTALKSTGGGEDPSAVDLEDRRFELQGQHEDLIRLLEGATSKEEVDQFFHRASDVIGEFLHRTTPEDKIPLLDEDEESEDLDGDKNETKRTPTTTTTTTRRNKKTISRRFAEEYERSFFEQFAELGVELPDVIARSSEHHAEVVAFIQTLIEKGFAYPTSTTTGAAGDVFFDSDAFSHAGFAFPTLGAGVAGGDDVNDPTYGPGSSRNKTKRHPDDFTLWVGINNHGSKIPEERSAGASAAAGVNVEGPVQDSPWGFGRPTWCVESAAMSSSVIGGTMDLLLGGVDLKYPHHDKVAALTEAYWDQHKDPPSEEQPPKKIRHERGMEKDATVAQEVGRRKFALHCNHLQIHSGRMMMRRVRRMVTVAQALNGLSTSSYLGEGFAPHHLRLLFLLSPIAGRVVQFPAGPEIYEAREIYFIFASSLSLVTSSRSRHRLSTALAGVTWERSHRG